MFFLLQTYYISMLEHIIENSIFHIRMRSYTWKCIIKFQIKNGQLYKLNMLSPSCSA